MPRHEHATPVSLGSPRFTTRDAGSFLVTDARFPAGHRLPRHFHDRAVVGITLAGEWDSVLLGIRLVNDPGTLHVEPAGDSHANVFANRGARGLIVQPDPADDTLRPFRSLLEAAHQLRIGAGALAAAERLRRGFRGPADPPPPGNERLSPARLRPPPRPAGG